MAHLIRHRDGSEEPVPLGDEWTVGRHADNALQLDDAAVSRHHARIRRERDAYVLTDLGTPNGTFLLRGGRRVRVVAAEPLQVGDTIILGGTELRVADLSTADVTAQLDADLTHVPGVTLVGRAGVPPPLDVPSPGGSGLRAWLRRLLRRP